MKRNIAYSFGIFLAIVLLQGCIFMFLSEQVKIASDERQAASELNSNINYIETRHYDWLQNLVHTIYTGAEFEGELDPEECSLGEWFHSEEIENTNDSVIKKYVNDLTIPHEEIHAGGVSILQELEKGNLATAKKIYSTRVVPNMNTTIDLLNGINEHSSKIITEKKAELDRINKINFMVMIVLIIVSFGFGIIIARKLIKRVVPPLKILTSASTELAEGHVNISIDENSMKDEFGVLAKAFNEMVVEIKHQAEVMNEISQGNYAISVPVRDDDDLMNIAINRMLDENNKMLNSIQQSAEQVASGAEQIASGAQMLASGSSEQSSKIEQLKVSISEILQNAEDNSRMASETMEEMLTAEKLMNESMEHMNKLNDAMDAIDKSSNAIAKVINLIEDIAFQTNILSLNAAVEAARAGQHGKGFAVVADEVRELSGKSADAANETSVLIEDSVSNASIGLNITDETNTSLNQMEKIVDGNTKAIEKTNEISKKQADSIASMAEGIEQIAIVVQSNSATSEESAASAEELSAQSQLLKDIVSKFKLRKR